jgi:carbonic anhydrase/acetyltransferase-like protein (isoleucine patch superfamily)
MRVLRAAVLLIAWTAPVHGDVDIGEKATVYPVAKHEQNSTVKKSTRCKIMIDHYWPE